ncbi:MAG: glutamate ligase domain-containing protein [Flavonifractor plautii]
MLRFVPTRMRMNMLHRGMEITILDDTYNANPQSMRAAISVLSDPAQPVEASAVLGDMFELGPFGPRPAHAGVGDCLGKAGIDCLVAVGRAGGGTCPWRSPGRRRAGVVYCPTKTRRRPGRSWTGVVRPRMPPFWSRPPAAWRWRSWPLICSPSQGSIKGRRVSARRPAGAGAPIGPSLSKTAFADSPERAGR